MAQQARGRPDNTIEDASTPAHIHNQSHGQTYNCQTPTPHITHKSGQQPITATVTAIIRVRLRLRSPSTFTSSHKPTQHAHVPKLCMHYECVCMDTQLRMCSATNLHWMQCNIETPAYRK
eukprot:1509942-Pleurochrysis_carterae.AAC.3